MFQPVTIFGFTLPIISVVLIVAAIAFLVIVQFSRTVVFNKLQNLFESKLYDEFLQTVDEPLSKFFVPSYNREYLRLNAHMAMGNAEKAKRSFDQLLTMRSTRTQRDDLLFKAFQFYMQQGLFKDAKGVLDEMKSYGRHADRVSECEKTWEIFGNKSYAYIDEMESAIDSAPYELKVSYALMLATQYASKGDEDKAVEWQDKAQKMLKEGKKK